MSTREGITAPQLALVAGFLTLLLIVCAVLGALRYDAERLHHPKVHSYNGTTWLGDQCYVDADGVLWCSGGTV